MSIRNSRLARTLINRALAATIALAAAGMATPSPAATTLRDGAPLHADPFHDGGPADYGQAAAVVDPQPGSADGPNQRGEDDDQSTFPACDSGQM